MRAGCTVRTEEAVSARAAAQTVLATALAWQQRGTSLAGVLLGGRAAGGEERHFPAADLVDRRAATRAFLHVHRHRGDPAGEWGHIHLFVADGPNYSHLAALVLDAQGLPLRWAATSQWVTGETWRSAAQMQPYLDAFSLQATGRLAPVARWLTAMVQLYRPALARMLARRDRTAACLGVDGQGPARLASCSANLITRIAALEAAPY